jgi:tRNA(fMet)-specific endonuclease VapC
VILLDTNICIQVINARPAAVLERFRQHRMGEIGVCRVVASELAYGDLLAQLERNGTPIGALVATIGAHALSQQSTLESNNTREFSRVPGLSLENWV